jgi:hypothetical protein
VISATIIDMPRDRKSCEASAFYDKGNDVICFFCSLSILSI